MAQQDHDHDSDSGLSLSDMDISDSSSEDESDQEDQDLGKHTHTPNPKAGGAWSGHNMGFKLLEATRICTFCLDSGVSYANALVHGQDIAAYLSGLSVDLCVLAETGMVAGGGTATRFARGLLKGGYTILLHAPSSVGGSFVRGKGVGLIYRSSMGAPTDLCKDEDGRGIAGTFLITPEESSKTKKLRIIALYGPSGCTSHHHSQKVAEEALVHWTRTQILGAADMDEIIVAGDLNSTPPDAVSESWVNKTSRPHSLFGTLVSGLDGVDCWRHLHPQAPGFTYMHESSASRLDAIISIGNNGSRPIATGTASVAPVVSRHLPLLTDFPWKKNYTDYSEGNQDRHKWRQMIKMWMLDKKQLNPEFKRRANQLAPQDVIQHSTIQSLNDLNRNSDPKHVSDTLDLGFEELVKYYKAVETALCKGPAKTGTKLDGFLASTQIDNLTRACVIFLEKKMEAEDAFPFLQLNIDEVKHWLRGMPKSKSKIVLAGVDLMPRLLRLDETRGASNISRKRVFHLSDTLVIIKANIVQHDNRLSRKLRKDKNESRKSAHTKFDARAFHAHINLKQKVKATFDPPKYTDEQGVERAPRNDEELKTAAYQMHAHCRDYDWPGAIDADYPINHLVSFTDGHGRTRYKRAPDAPIQPGDAEVWSLFGTDSPITSYDFPVPFGSEIDLDSLLKIARKVALKLPGNSGMKPCVAPMLPEIFSSLLLALVNAMIRSCTVPTKAALVDLLYIPKPNGGGRPLGLFEEIVKIVDTVFVNRTMEAWKAHGYKGALCGANHAYQASQSVSETLLPDMLLCEKAARAKERVGSSDTVRLDLDLYQWFDHLPRPTLEAEMYALQMPEEAMDFWSDMDHKASCGVMTRAGSSPRFKMKCGIYQGIGSSCLRSLCGGNPLWKGLRRCLSLLPSKEAELLLRPMLEIVEAFSDDTTVITDRQGLQSILDFFSRVAPKLGIGISREKIRIISWDPELVGLECTYKTWNWRSNSVIDGVIKVLPAYDCRWKSLGILRSGVTGDSQQDQMLTKKLHALLQRLAPMKFTPAELRTTIQTHILSHLQFAPLSYRMSLHNLSGLDKVIRGLFQKALRVPRTTPISSIYACEKDGGWQSAGALATRLTALHRELSIFLNEENSAGFLIRREWDSLCSLGCRDTTLASCTGHAAASLATFGFYIRDQKDQLVNRMLDAMAAKHDPPCLEKFVKTTEINDTYSSLSTLAHELRNAMSLIAQGADDTLDETWKGAAKFSPISASEMNALHKTAIKNRDYERRLEAKIHGIRPSYIMALDRRYSEQWPIDDTLLASRGARLGPVFIDGGCDASDGAPAAGYGVVELVPHDPITRSYQEWPARHTVSLALPARWGNKPASAQIAELMACAVAVRLDASLCRSPIVGDSLNTLRLCDLSRPPAPPRCPRYCGTAQFRPSESLSCVNCNSQTIWYWQCRSCGWAMCRDCALKCFGPDITLRDRLKYKNSPLVEMLHKLCLSQKSRLPTFANRWQEAMRRPHWNGSASGAWQTKSLIAGAQLVKIKSHLDEKNPDEVVDPNPPCDMAIEGSRLADEAATCGVLGAKLMRGVDGDVLYAPSGGLRFATFARGGMCLDPLAKVVPKQLQAEARRHWSDSDQRPVMGAFAAYLDRIASPTINTSVYRNIAIPPALIARYKNKQLVDLSRQINCYRQAIGGSWTSLCYYNSKYYKLATHGCPDLGLLGLGDSCPVCFEHRGNLRGMMLCCRGSDDLSSLRNDWFNAIESKLASALSFLSVSEPGEWLAAKCNRPDQNRPDPHHLRERYPILFKLGWILPGPREKDLQSHVLRESVWDMGYRCIIPNDLMKACEDCDDKEALMVDLATTTAIYSCAMRQTIDKTIKTATGQWLSYSLIVPPAPPPDQRDATDYPCTGARCRAVTEAGWSAARVARRGAFCPTCASVFRTDTTADALIRSVKYSTADRSHWCIVTKEIYSIERLIGRLHDPLGVSKCKRIGSEAALLAGIVHIGHREGVKRTLAGITAVQLACLCNCSPPVSREQHANHAWGSVGKTALGSMDPATFARTSHCRSAPPAGQIGTKAAIPGGAAWVASMTLPSSAQAA